MDEAGVDLVDEVIDQVDELGQDSDSSNDSTQDTTVDVKADDPYSSKSSREYSQWLKALREEKANDPTSAKFARLSKDNHARLYQLQQMEPRGIDGVRETYALLDSVMHGELKGRDAIGALQDELRGVQEIDERLFSGDAGALKEMGEEFMQQALPKLAGPILDMVRDTNPEAYSAAVLPHLVGALLATSQEPGGLINSFNGLVDVLNEAPPKWLTPDQKTQWTEDRINRVMGLAGKMGQWFNAQQAKAGELPKTNGQNPVKPSDKPSELDTLRKEQETQHWNTNITPKLDQHADSRFSEQFRAYDKRLRLDANAKADLKSAFIQGIIKKANANSVYASQIKRYHSQSKPDANTVLNFAKVEFDKHAKTVMEGLVNQRYKPFLAGPQKQQIQQVINGQKKGPVAPGVQIVTQKPKNIDFKNTPLEMLHQKIYKTLDGKTVKWQQ